MGIILKFPIFLEEGRDWISLFIKFSSSSPNWLSLWFCSFSFVFILIPFLGWNSGIFTLGRTFLNTDKSLVPNKIFYFLF